MRKRVDLPEPFTPMKPTFSPSSTANETPSKRVRGPKDLCRSCTFRTFAIVSRRVDEEPAKIHRRPGAVRGGGEDRGLVQVKQSCGSLRSRDPSSPPAPLLPITGEGGSTPRAERFR